MIFDKLGEIIGEAFRGIIDAIGGLLKWNPQMLSEIDRELIEKSLDPDKYDNPDVKALVERIKKSVEHSPEGISEWVETIAKDVFGTVHDVMNKVLVPFDVPDFEAAKVNAGYLTTAFTGFILLASTLDAVSNVMSITLVRHVFQYLAFALQFFGFKNYMDVAMMPAVNASILPRLVQGYNQQYQAEIPNIQDIIRMAAREIWEPKWRKLFELDRDFPEPAMEWFNKAGYNAEWAKNWWAAHWALPGISAVLDMWHRGMIDEEVLDAFFVELDMVPYWRDYLKKQSFTVFTRVDVRRMWDIAVLDDKETITAYTDLGYPQDKAEKMLLFTKLFQRLPDLRARFSKGWITADDMVAQMIGWGLPEERAKMEMETLIDAEKGERTAKERDLTKSEIIKGVKKEIITWADGVDLLMDMGYDSWEAEYMLAVNVGVAEGSPETYPEFKDWTQKWRAAMGMPRKEVSEELKEAAKELARVHGEVEALRKAEKEELATLVKEEPRPPEAEKALKDIQVKLHRAEAELERVKTHYESLLTQFKYGEEKR